MQNDTPPDSPEAIDPKRKRILLIEDEPIARLQLLQKLRESGFDVDVASNGQVALERIRTIGLDAIFMDLLLPDLKGVDVIKAARQDPKFGERPIYVCTSAALIDTWTRRATKAGATKVFDRAITPMDAIAAQVKTDLLGVAPPVSTTPPPPPVEGAANGKPQGTDSTKASPPPQPVREQPQTKSSTAEPKASDPAARPAPLLKRVFNSFRFTKPSAPVRPNDPPAPPPVVVPPAP